MVGRWGRWSTCSVGLSMRSNAWSALQCCMQLSTLSKPSQHVDDAQHVESSRGSCEDVIDHRGKSYRLAAAARSSSASAWPTTSTAPALLSLTSSVSRSRHPSSGVSPLKAALMKDMCETTEPMSCAGRVRTPDNHRRYRPTHRPCVVTRGKGRKEKRGALVALAVVVVKRRAKGDRAGGQPSVGDAAWPSTAPTCRRGRASCRRETGAVVAVSSGGRHGGGQ